MQQHRSGTVNWRRTDDGVELYDESNDDAWIRMAVEPGASEAERPYSVCPECGVVAAQRTVPTDHMVCGDCGAEFENDD
jgi:ribosomal protein S27AE